MLLGADAMEEDEFAAMSLEAGSLAKAAKRYRKELCEGWNQPCAKEKLK